VQALRAEEECNAHQPADGQHHPSQAHAEAVAFIGCNQDLHVLSRNYEVLRESTVPSILIESCMLTNQCQQNKIALDSNQGIVTDGIAAGVSFAITPGGTPSRSARSLGGSGADSRAAAAASPRVQVERGNQIESASEGFEGATFPPTGWTSTT